MITDVALTENCPFNLFSLTKMMMKGWTLSGENNVGIKLSKEDKSLIFDVPIETPKRVVYARRIQQPFYDKMISAEILLPHGDDMQMRNVIGRTLGDHGSTMGSYDDNPVLNLMIYDVEFPDGNFKQYAANILAENMLSQLDPYGYNTILMKEIIDYRRDDSAVPLEDKYLTTRSGQRSLRKTTQGWELLVAWKDGTESWVRLATLKDLYPVELAEYAKARGNDNEPAFAWWVPRTIRRRNDILSAVKARCQKKSHKFGIELPTTINHARELDRINENNLWMEALQKEMFNIGIAFEVLEDGASAPKGWNRSLVTLYGMLRWILQEKPDGYWMATSRLTLKVVHTPVLCQGKVYALH
jgi:hypothetical protein